jgi:hypothetical protein
MARDQRQKLNDALVQSIGEVPIATRTPRKKESRKNSEIFAKQERPVVVRVRFEQ